MFKYFFYLLTPPSSLLSSSKYDETIPNKKVVIDIRVKH
jgi:hypothetical protein